MNKADRKHQINILIIDEDKIFQQFFKLVLNCMIPSEVKSACSEELIYKYINDFDSNDGKADLIFLSLKITDFDVLKFVKKIKKDPVNWDIPIIILTENESMVDIEKLFQAGVFDYFSKIDVDTKAILDNFSNDCEPTEDTMSIMRKCRKFKSVRMLRARLNSALKMKKEIDKRKKTQQNLESKNLKLVEHYKKITMQKKELLYRRKKLIAQNKYLETVLKEIKQDRFIAGRIQASLLPVIKKFKNFNLEWIFRPCSDVGGDIFNVFELEQDKYGVYILDVSGHGIQASLLSVTLSKVLSKEGVAENLLMKSGIVQSPATVLNILNEKFQMDEDFQQYFTIIYGILDISEKTFTYSSAGHTPIFSIIPDAKLEQWEEPAPPIGMVATFDYKLIKKDIVKGQRLFLYSDGVLDAVRDSNKSGDLGLEKFEETIVSFSNCTLKQCLVKSDRVLRELEGKNQKDDITIIGFEFT